MRQMRNMVAAFKDLKFFEGLDLEKWMEVAVGGGAQAFRGRVKRLGRKPAREAGKEATEAFLTAESYEEGLEAFKNSLRDSVKEAMLAGFQQALLWNGPLGAMMTDFFGTTAKLFKKMLKRGPTDVLLERLARETDVAMNDMAEYMKLLEDWLPKVWEMINGYIERLEEQMKTATDRWKEEVDRLNTVDQIMKVWSDAVYKITNLFRAQADTIARLDQKIYAATGEEGPAPGVAEAYLRAAGAQQFTFLTAIKDIFDPETQLKGLAQIEDTVDQFLAAAVREITAFFAPAIEEARKANELAEAVTETIHGLGLSALSPKSTEERLAEIRDQIQEQQKILLQGDPEEQLEAAKKIRDLNADLLDIGQAELDQAGPMFRSLFAEVMNNYSTLEETLKSMGSGLEELEAAQERELQLVREQAKSYYDWIKTQSMPLLAQERQFENLATTLGGFVTAQTTALGTDFINVVNALTGQEGIAPILKSELTGENGVGSQIGKSVLNLKTALLGEDGPFGPNSALGTMSNAMQTLNDPEEGPLSGVISGVSALPGLFANALADGAKAPLWQVKERLLAIKNGLWSADKATLDLILGGLNAIARGQEPPPVVDEGDTAPPAPTTSWTPTHEGLITRVRKAYKEPWHPRHEWGGFGARDWDKGLGTDAVLNLLYRAIDAKVKDLGRGDSEKTQAAAFAQFLKDMIGAQRALFPSAEMTYLQVSGMLEVIKGFFQNNAPAGVRGMNNAWVNTRDWFLKRIGSLTPLLEGGIVRRPTAALLGEKDREAVIPLNSDSIRLLTDSLAVELASALSRLQRQFSRGSDVSRVTERLLHMVRVTNQQMGGLTKNLVEQLLQATERLIVEVRKLAPEPTGAPIVLSRTSDFEFEPFASKLIFLLERVRDGQEEMIHRMAATATAAPAAAAVATALPASRESATSSNTIINLQVAEGAFTATLHNADPTVVRELPERMLEQFERSVRHGRLGAVIERRLKR
jgi:hypothetical protein